MTTLLFILLLVVFITVSVSVHNKNAWGGLFILVVGTIAYLFIENVSYRYLLTAIAENIGNIIIFGFVYLILGVIWSFIKWYLTLKDLKKKGKSREYIYVSSYYEAIITWMMFFPISILLFLCTDAVLRFYYIVEKQVSGVYARILNNVFPEETKPEEKVQILKTNKK